LLDDQPLHDLEFFSNIRRQHHPPYYSIEGIHFEADEEEKQGPESEIRVLGCNCHLLWQGSDGPQCLENPGSQNPQVNENTEVENAAGENSREEGHAVDEGHEDGGLDSDTSEENFSDPEIEHVSTRC
jgi:hypothetical protein